jgi:hypothetical protein
VRPLPIETARLHLEPLAEADVDELFALLDDPVLHTYIGGEPMTREELERWIAFVAPGRSPSGNEIWCNWVVRLRQDGTVVGTTQATVNGDVASIAWLIGSAAQGRGFAKEAAAAVSRPGWRNTTSVDSGPTSILITSHPTRSPARSVSLRPTSGKTGKSSGVRLDRHVPSRRPTTCWRAGSATQMRGPSFAIPPVAWDRCRCSSISSPSFPVTASKPMMSPALTQTMPSA